MSNLEGQRIVFGNPLVEAQFLEFAKNSQTTQPFLLTEQQGRLLGKVCGDFSAMMWKAGDIETSKAASHIGTHNCTAVKSGESDELLFDYQLGCHERELTREICEWALNQESYKPNERAHLMHIIRLTPNIIDYDAT